METVDATNEFQDWEVLHPNSDSESESTLLQMPCSVDTFEEIDSEGIIRANYFSLDSRNRYVTAHGEDSVDNKSDNRSLIDPGLEENPNRYLSKESDEFSSDSSSAKFNDFVCTNEMGSEDIKQITLQKVEEAQFLGKNYYSTSGEVEEGSIKLNELEENSEIDMKEKANLCEGLEVSGEDKCERKDSRNEIEGINEKETAKSHEIVNRGVLWWKMPMEFMRYCVFRVSPVWTVSVAAAMIGFLIVGRRLYKMKKKTRALQIKVTVDNKVSQVMNRAARLNEAFYVVKRLPIIRPSLPAVGVTTWPVASIR
ncbi:Hypothetical predicted protein [Olea europaea subsp. europaea]|uniref:DUF6821 domain-containing protein n=1 Tax=Olea europaea subsp. europaea TaxID=158383 RepID=A0A8S0U8R9_OLEEU|nr:Hypothetical predicted protein [Olea europaea subsp. europaea]